MRRSAVLHALSLLAYLCVLLSCLFPLYRLLTLESADYSHLALERLTSTRIETYHRCHDCELAPRGVDLHLCHACFNVTLRTPIFEPTPPQVVALDRARVRQEAAHAYLASSPVAHVFSCDETGGLCHDWAEWALSAAIGGCERVTPFAFAPTTLLAALGLLLCLVGAVGGGVWLVQRVRDETRAETRAAMVDLADQDSRALNLFKQE